jgi:hypothetical protein
MTGSDRPTTDAPHLFFLRLWREELTQGEVEWRGQMTALASGEVRYFRSPATLYEVLLTMLANEPSGIRAVVSPGVGNASAAAKNVQ